MAASLDVAFTRPRRLGRGEPATRIAKATPGCTSSIFARLRDARPSDRVVRSTSRFNASEDHPLPVRKADENFIDIDATTTTPGEKKKIACESAVALLASFSGKFGRLQSTSAQDQVSHSTLDPCFYDS
ncbi:hypothetical protein ACVIWV_005537 [Bradyrhizobium diazoefficiens]|uniref:hypothetical protein n=1 Tax=Bradyrhizobium TaxID=374 RepID=UPI000A968BA0|nr:hypothetical protein [Bradyrhizobium diazoefficiens]MBR0866011.1 hypothetical protein [Bradyrhizobium diazoefficiens]MBR0890539.1 hypothetical protein [Bradyrhizobium diazoefficiens]MBR0922331.1 hypothetical protein [Bradyrhizobium diazoefficiens]